MKKDLDGMNKANQFEGEHKNKWYNHFVATIEKKKAESPKSEKTKRQLKKIIDAAYMESINEYLKEIEPNQ